MLTIKKATGTNNSVYPDAAKIRQAVFVKEQGIDADLEFDTLDDQTTHYVGYLDDQPVVTARLNATDEWHIQRVATLASERHNGYAAQLLKQLIADAEPGSLLSLNAQETAIGLYKQLGFEVIGAPFQEVGITHVAMQRQK